MSNSFMVGERSGSAKAGSAPGPVALWAGSRSGEPGSQTANGVAFTVGTCIIPLNIDPIGEELPLGSGISNGSWHSFSSLHRGGAHFLLGDGGVCFISENIDYQVYGRLGNIADGKAVGQF